MVSWLVRSSPDRSGLALSSGACFSSEGPEKFPHPESRSIISNLMITDGCFIYILLV